MNVIEFAIMAHHGQKRKYSDEPYIVHPCRVAQSCVSVGCDQATVEAAWLHDVIEDTDVTLNDIFRLYGASEFGQKVVTLVESLSDLLTPADGNRAMRQAMYVEKMRHADPRAKTVKLADIIDNTLNICEHDPDFGKVYIKEVNEMMKVLKEGNSRLFAKAIETMVSGVVQLAQPPFV